MPEKEQHAWWKEAVIYQIYPRSFMDANGDGIGDLAGITQRIPYLSKLGVDVVWLSPVYASPNDDNGYDISDYRAIMKDFGTMEDFDTLLATAHKAGIKIVMDLVVNHTSDEHAWFIESRKSRTNPYRDYYIWRDGKDGKEPNNWESCFSGPAWQYDEATGQYYLHLFSKKQVDLNWENPKVRDEVYDLMTFWCDKGIDGFRMDVISMISKDQRFPDGPVKPDGYGDFSPYCISGPRVHEFLQEMNQRVLSKYDLLTVGEAAGVTIDEAKKYARSDGKELGMVFQFEHVGSENGKGSIVEKWTTGKPKLANVRAILNKWQTELEGCAWNSLYWDNHDQPRCVSMFGNDAPEYRVRSAKMLATCLHMMKGTPYIYQGEELGMTNVQYDIEDYKDCEIINMYHERLEKGYSKDEIMKSIYAKGRDNARTPMQWDDSANAGFTTGTPWIKVNDNYDKINAKSQVDDPDSIFSCYKKLVQLRKDYPVFVDGKFTLLLEDDENIFAYSRKNEEKTMIVVCNFFDKEIPMPLAKECEGMEVLISNYKDTSDMSVLRPYEARMYIR